MFREDIAVVCHGRAKLRNKADFIRKVRLIRKRAGREDLSIAILLTDDEGIRELNRIFKKKNAPTDVLAFESTDDRDHMCLGDIAISVDTARANAREYRATLRDEIFRYVAHGILHLSGWDDDTPRKRDDMRDEEDRLIRNL